VHQLTLKEVHDGNYKLAGRKSYIYHPNRRNQIARQPTKIMISLAISFGDVSFLPVIEYLRNLVVRHLDSGHNCRRSGRSIPLYLEVALVATGGRLGGDRRILISFTSHGERSGSNAKSSKCEAVKIGQQE
jgi:hypothetical protein